MAFSPLRNSACRIVFKLADWLHFWRYPADIDVEDLKSFWRMTYWFYISGRPVTRAEKGSGLETFFERQRQAPAPLLPPGFQRHTSLSFSAVGDLMCNKGLEHSAGRFYERVAHLIFDADVSFANLESSLTSGPIVETAISKDDLPKINANPAQFDVIKGHEGKNYTVVQTANNHILDCGFDGILTTHSQLEKEGIRFTGTNRSGDEQEKGMILDSAGPTTAPCVRLGFVTATWGVNNRPFPEGKEYLVNVVRFHQHAAKADLSLLKKQLAWCRTQGCDLVIAGLHWGCEWEFFPRRYQIDMAHELAEAGADLIIGHHSHVIQPLEWYRTQRDPDRLVPIFYNLGNLVAIANAPFSALSLIASLKLVKGRVGNETKTLVESLGVVPVFQMNHESNGATRVWLETLQHAWANRTGSDRWRIEEAAKYADLVLGPGWRESAI